jgi:predicted MPP superfamily phosphohydrolase
MPLMTRRRFIASAALSAAGGLCVYGSVIEPGWLDVVNQELRLPRLPDAFADFTIAQISDLHFGRLVKPGHLEPAINQVRALDADAIVITGDLVSRLTNGEPDMIVQTLSPLRALAGVFAVLGNHDYWEGSDVVAAALRRAGVTVLCNEHVPLRRGGQVLYLAGVDDVCCDHCDLEATLRGIPTAGAVVALVHEPDYADIAARDPRVILQLSGHSHGGQVCIPLIGGLHFPRWGRTYPSGLYRVGDLTLYTNRGLGVIGVPIRLACRPEVTLHTLKPAC